jgi:hypothetical protein
MSIRSGCRNIIHDQLKWEGTRKLAKSVSTQNICSLYCSYQWRGGVLLSATYGPSLGPAHVLAQRILLHPKMQSRASRGSAYSEVRIPGLGSGEEEEMSDAQWSGHSDIVSQAIRAAFFQATGSTRLHNHSDVFGQLTNAGTDFAGADTNNHALRI